MLDKKNKEFLYAIFFMVLASAFIATTSIIAKILGKSDFGNSLNPLQISHSRFFFAFLFIALFTFRSNPIPDKAHLHLHLARTVSGWVGVTILFGSTSLIPIADAVAINFTNPIFAMLFAILLLGEKIGLYRWFAAFITFLGALILIRPSYNLSEYEPIAIISLIGALILGLEAIFIKLLVKLENKIQILFINNLIGLILSSIPIFFVWINPSVVQIFFCILIGLFMLIGQYCFLEALKRCDVSLIAPFFYNTLIFVIIFDFIIFKNLPDNVSISGAILIIVGGLILLYRQRQNIFNS